MALPALRELSHNQYRAFRKQIQSLVSADRKMSLFEWTLQRALLRHLRPHFGTVRPARVKYRSMQRIAAPCSVVLSTLLHVEAQAGADAHRAYADCTARLGLPSQPLASEHCGLAILDEALTTLDQATPALKRKILAACAEIIAADGSVSVAEAELFRAIADSLGCPVPPILPGQALAPGTAAV